MCDLINSSKEILFTRTVFRNNEHNNNPALCFPFFLRIYRSDWCWELAGWCRRREAGSGQYREQRVASNILMSAQSQQISIIKWQSEMNISQPNNQPQQIVYDDKNFEIQLCFKYFNWWLYFLIILYWNLNLKINNHTIFTL